MVVNFLQVFDTQSELGEHLATISAIYIFLAKPIHLRYKYSPPLSCYPYTPCLDDNCTIR